MLLNLDDQHFPTLTVEQTIDFAAANKVSFVPVNFENAKSFISYRTSSILSSLGISHIKDTIVGSEFVRGVSGGERKRVSIAEVMATQVRVSFLRVCAHGLELTVRYQGPSSMLG